VIEPEYEHLRAVERALMGRRGFRQVFDEVTFSDDRDESEIPEDEEWTPLQREILEDVARAVLNASSRTQGRP
jgi:hypothetical protein